MSVPAALGAQRTVRELAAKVGRGAIRGAGVALAGARAQVRKAGQSVTTTASRAQSEAERKKKRVLDPILLCWRTEEEMAEVQRVRAERAASNEAKSAQAMAEYRRLLAGGYTKEQASRAVSDGKTQLGKATAEHSRALDMQVAEEERIREEIRRRMRADVGDLIARGELAIDELKKIPGRVAGKLTEAAVGTIKEFVIEPGMRYLGETISGSLGSVFKEYMGMPFARGVEIGEATSKDLPGVVRLGSPEIRRNIEATIISIQDELRATGEVLVKQIEREASPVTPELSAKLAGTLAAGALTGLVGLTATSSAIEAASLGQLEIPGHFLLQLGTLYGLGRMAGAIVNVPYRWAVDAGYNYYMAQRFTPMIPSQRNIIEMYSRGGLTSEEAHGLMRFHGFGPGYDHFWDELKNTPLRYFALNALSRAGLYDETVFREELDRSGYSFRSKFLLDRAFRIGEMTAEVREGFGSLRKLLKEGFRMEKDARAMWEEFRTEDDPIERQFVVARWEYEFDYKTDTRALILDQFVKKILDRTRATEELLKIIPAIERVEILLDRAELRIRIPKARFESD